MLNRTNTNAMKTVITIIILFSIFFNQYQQKEQTNSIELKQLVSLYQKRLATLYQLELTF